LLLCPGWPRSLPELLGLQAQVTVLGFKLRASCLLGRCSNTWDTLLELMFFVFLFSLLGFELRAYTLSHSTFFVMDFLEIGSHKLFAWAGFKLWFSWSLPPE
jgi:hypothetical protein